MAKGKHIKVNCPKCKNEFSYYDSEFRPFCSERCKQVDLGLWFNETYTVASEEKLTDNDLQKVIENLENGDSNNE